MFGASKFGLAARRPRLQKRTRWPKRAPAQLTANTLVPEQKPLEEKARPECTAKGGKVRPVCRSGRLMSVVAYPDAGKACSNNSDCASNKCIADPENGPIGAPVAGKCKVNTCRPRLPG